MTRDPHRMTPAQREDLYEACNTQAQNENAPRSARLWALSAMRDLQRLGVTLSGRRQAPATPPRVPRAAELRTVEQRVNDAREALYGPVEVGGYEDPAGRSVQQRVEDAKAFLAPAQAGTVRR